MHEYFVNSMPLKVYKRIQFRRKASWDMDNAKIVDDLLETWKPDIAKAIKVVNAF